jgi:ribosomal protein S18 acetylase RimI-like enzyme
VPDETRHHSLRPAAGSDADAVSALVERAYGPYVDRIGMLPGPMTEDYAAVIRDKRVTLAERDGAIVGLLVLDADDEGFVIDNVAVDPAVRGTGLGRTLLELAEAEARRAGVDSIHLYTHEAMTENLDLYARIGYVEYDRRSFGEFSLVFMRKSLGAAKPSNP